MPPKLLSPCRYRGCHRVIPGGGFCDAHKRELDREYNRERRADPNRNDAFYSSAEWRRLRETFLRSNPLCADCLAEGRRTPATDVDHIVPIRRGGAKLDLSNLRALCRSHHARKSVRDGSRWGAAASPSPSARG